MNDDDWSDSDGYG